MISCAYSLCACGRRIEESELLKPLVMLSESRGSWRHRRYSLKLIFRFLFFKRCSAVPFHFARAGVVFESVYLWGHFSCWVKGEDPNGIAGLTEVEFSIVDDVGWSWVFDFCFWMMLRVEFFLKSSCSLCACGCRIWACKLIVFSLRSVSCLWSLRGML